MRELFLCETLPDGRQFCVAPLSRDTFEANQAYDLGDDAGYFIYEYDTGNPHAGIEILGKAASWEAAVRLMDIYAMAARSGDIGRSEAA